MALELKTNTEEVGRVVLFTIDEVPYSIPNKVRTNLQLQFMRINREDPDGSATWLLQTLLGKEAFSALENYDDLTPEDLEQVFLDAAKVVLGVTESQILGKAREAKTGGQ